MKRNFKGAAAAGVLAVLLLASGCEKKATGQIVAVVNGEEISLQELNAELEGVNLPATADKKLVMKQVLQQVIDRRLLAQTAKEEGLDRDPTYVTQQRKMSEELLVRMYAKKAADAIRVPDAGAIDKYIAEHPAMFTGRTRYKVDQLQFDMPGDVAQLKKLEGDHSLEAVAASLTAMGIKFQRGAGAIDSGAIPPETLKQIVALPAGEPFIVPAGGKVVVSVITGSEPLLVPADQSRPIAVQAIRNEGLSKVGETRLKEARAKAKIEYQPNYEPAPAAKPAAAK
ncbi:EpsD family peptidyl-prolyl cis-trans isomerase [Sphingobium boeckii]|uniref:peptidylprolyl isomerase n=1 Tax=Sphingobium boeckii TaxID=1082345 RepID=A0A7W9AJL8_9SPHN|nr:EpsD family peptidyl-prolyl cis-trans isomerase [Sphingobium boeckii]MBB5686637.1 EpsD family peptidyl-prolyl cis-trans isomerase [Sphingobium boeckii]